MEILVVPPVTMEKKYGVIMVLTSYSPQNLVGWLALNQAKVPY